MADPHRLPYARARPRRRGDPVQRIFAILVIANTALFTPSVLTWKFMAGTASTAPFHAGIATLVEYTLEAYGLLFLTSLVILLAQRRQDRSWSFSLSALFCALMACVGLCADVMSH